MNRRKRKERWVNTIAIIAWSICLFTGIFEGTSVFTESKFYKRSVLLRNETSMCSGVQVRSHYGIDYVLTAAHCKDLQDENGEIRAIPDATGKEIKLKIIVEDDQSDLLLLEGISNLKGLSIADSVRINQNVRTFTHGGGFPTHKSEGVLLGEAPEDIPIFPIFSKDDYNKCKKEKKNTVEMGLFSDICVTHMIAEATTAFVSPGSSGGMVVNDRGQLVGIVSATNESTKLYYLVRLVDIQRFISGRGK